jgi:hypothetical protein
MGVSFPGNPRRLGTQLRTTKHLKSGLASSFMRMSVGSSGVFVGKLAMFVSCSCVLLGFFVLAKRMVMLGLKMMMRGGMVMSGR